MWVNCVVDDAYLLAQMKLKVKVHKSHVPNLTLSYPNRHALASLVAYLPHYECTYAWNEGHRSFKRRGQLSSSPSHSTTIHKLKFDNTPSTHHAGPQDALHHLPPLRRHSLRLADHLLLRRELRPRLRLRQLRTSSPQPSIQMPPADLAIDLLR